MGRGREGEGGREGCVCVCVRCVRWCEISSKLYGLFPS